MFLMPMGDDDRDAMRVKLEQMALADSAFISDLHDLFGSLEPEKLATLRAAFHGIVGAGSPRSYAAYLEGHCSALLNIVHKVCPGCGRDHAEEFLEGCTAEPNVED